LNITLDANTFADFTGSKIFNVSSHILRTIRIETQRRKKSADSAYFCSVFVWVNRHALPIEHLRLNEFEEFLKAGKKDETK